MISILVCLIQITLIASLALNASKVFLSISPQLSARMSWLGIALSSLVVVATTDAELMHLLQRPSAVHNSGEPLHASAARATAARAASVSGRLSRRI